MSKEAQLGLDHAVRALIRRRGRRELDHEIVRTAIDNLTGFFGVLHGWARTECDVRPMQYELKAAAGQGEVP